MPVTYVEHLVPSPLACCTWERCTIAPAEQRIVPDACIDLIWSGERLSIAGPDTRSRVVALAPGTRVVAVRLRPGAAGAVLGVPAWELRDEVVAAAEMLGRAAAETLLDALHAGADPHHTLLRAIHTRASAPADPLVRAALAGLDRPHARVSSVAADLGVSARQLQRRVSHAVGYGPKMVARVLRFRRLQALSAARTVGSGRRPLPAEASLAELALDAGYADQAHMTAEVTHLAGIPPVRFLKDRAPTAA